MPSRRNKYIPCNTKSIPKTVLEKYENLVNSFESPPEIIKLNEVLKDFSIESKYTFVCQIKQDIYKYEGKIFNKSYIDYRFAFTVSMTFGKNVVCKIGESLYFTYKRAFVCIMVDNLPWIVENVIPKDNTKLKGAFLNIVY